MTDRLPLIVPEPIEDHVLIASVSGGKDSSAAALALIESGIEFRAVLADTGWEAEETYDHNEYLREEFRRRAGVEVATVTAEERGNKPAGGMVEHARYRAGFPMRQGRWCTQELKIEPIRAFHAAVEKETGSPCAAVVGVRGAESDKRALMPELTEELEGPRSFGWPVWRPLIAWSVEDVLRIHQRHGLKLNPLYHRGHNRVGCYPCIHSNKEEIRLIAENSPGRIDEIRGYEKEFTELRASRNAEKPGRYANAEATFFSARHGKRADIDTVVEWSRTARGGRQLPLLEEPPTGGCYRWGLCEPEPKS